MNKKLIFMILLITNQNINSQKIFINSIYKCGTHLLQKCIELLTKKAALNLGQDLVTINKLPPLHEDLILLYHVEYSDYAFNILKNNKFLGVFIYRDPRDQLVSDAFWRLNHPHILEGLLQFPKGYVPTLSEVLDKSICLIKDAYGKYLPWKNTGLFYSLKFEDLVGNKGGGSDLKQYITIKNIGAHLNIKLDNNTIEYCMRNLFGNTPTFREGQIGSWKKYFTKEQIRLFKNVTGNLLIDLGYEKDNNW